MLLIGAGSASWFSGLWEGIKNTFSGGWDLVKKLFSFSPLGLVIKAWQPMLNWVSEKMGWISDLAGGIKSFFSDEPETKQPQPKNTTGQQLAKQTSMAAAVSAAVAVTPVSAVPAQASPNQTTITNQYTLQITQQPGESGEELARRVIEEIKATQTMNNQGAQYDHE